MATFITLSSACPPAQVARHLIHMYGSSVLDEPISTLVENSDNFGLPIDVYKFCALQSPDGNYAATRKAFEDIFFAKRNYGNTPLRSLVETFACKNLTGYMIPVMIKRLHCDPVMDRLIDAVSHDLYIYMADFFAALHEYDLVCLDVEAITDIQCILAIDESYRGRDPIILQVRVVQGECKIGTQLHAIVNNERVDVGEVITIKHRPRLPIHILTIHIYRADKAVKFGKHFGVDDMLLSDPVGFKSL